MKIRRLIVFFIFLLISTVSYSQVIRGYKVQREYGADTIVGYESRNLDLTGYAGTAFVVGDTAYIYYNGKVMRFVAPRYLFPGITSYTSNDFLVLKGDTLYKRSIASLGGADSVYFLPGLVTSSEGYYGIGDTLKIDTSKATIPPPDTFYVVYGDVRSEGLISSGDTIFIDTAHVVLDSIYILPTTLWSGAGWIFSGDTLRVDTTGGGVDSYWQRSGERLTPAETMDSVYTAHGGMAPVIVYGSNIVSNGGFETYTGHSGGLAQFTDWFNGTTQSGYIDTAAGYVGAYSVKLSDGGTQSASILQQSRSMTSGVRYKLSFYHKGAAMVYQLYRGTTGFNASTGAWAVHVVNNTIPAATNWTRYDINFTAPTTATNYELKFDQTTNGSTTYIDAVQIATFAEHMAITSSYPLHFTATKYLVKSLTATTSDTALILRGDTLYKGKVTMDVPVDSLKINGIWYFSGDSLTIAIDYDSINVDSLITGAMIDSIITTINIDSITQLIVIGYLDTSSAVRDTFEVVYGTTQQPGWVSSGDQIYIDTSGQVVDTFQLSGDFLEISLSEVNEVHRVFLGKYVDSLYVEYCDGCALTSGLVLSGNTIYIDTARRQDTIVSSVITSDTIYSIIINVDSIYLENDTIVDYIWRPGDGGFVNAKLKASTSYITGNHTVVLGFNDSVVANYGFSAGAYNKVSGAAGVAIGFLTEAGGETSFAGGRGYFSVNQRLKATGNAAFNFSRIVGAGEQSNASGDQSAILGGKNNSATGEGTAVIGGDGIIGTRNYTTYVNDLYTVGEIYLSDTSYIDDVGGMLAIFSKNGFAIATDTSALIYDVNSFRPFAAYMNIDIGKDSLFGFNNGYFEGTVYADKLQVSDNAAAGRVLVAQNSAGLAQWEPVSELTGTADTFYLPGEGWLQSGDTITLPVVDSSKWSRSTGRLVSKHVGDTVGVGDKGHLVPYGAAGEVLIDFEDFVGYDTTDAILAYWNFPDDIYEYVYYYESSYNIDTTTGITGIGLLINCTETIPSPGTYTAGVALIIGDNGSNIYRYHEYPTEISLWYKGDGLLLGVGHPYGYHWDGSDWVQCDEYIAVFRLNQYPSALNWTQIKIQAPKLTQCNDIYTYQLYILPPDSIGASVSIDDIRVSYVDSGMNIVSEGSLHLTPSDNLYAHNLPSTTTDTLLGLDGDRVVKTAITIPVSADSSKWQVSGTTLAPKDSTLSVSIGKKAAGYPLDVNGAGMFNGRTYWQSTNVFAQNDGTNGLYLAGYNDIKFAIGGSTKYTATTTYFRPSANNTVDLGQTSNRWKNIYAGTKIFTPNIQLSSLSTNTTSTDVLVLNGSEVEKRNNIALWYSGTGGGSYMSRSDGVASAANSIAIGYKAEATGVSSLSGGNSANFTGFETKATGYGSFNWQQGGWRSITSGLGAATIGGYQNYNAGLFSVIAGGDGNTINGRANPNIKGNNFIGASTSASIDSSHVGAAIIASYGGASLANYTLHTDNLHVYDTISFSSISDGVAVINGGDLMSIEYTDVLKFISVDTLITTDTLTAGAKQTYIRVNDTSDVTIYLPQGIASPGHSITIEQMNIGQVTVAPLSGVTINTYAGLMTAGRYAVLQLVNVGGNTWTCIGGVE